MALLRLDCPHCPTEQVAFTLVWHSPGNRVGRWFGTAVCGACHRPVSFELQHSSPNNATAPAQVVGLLQPTFDLVELWPERPEASAPPHTPLAVARRFKEGEHAYQRASWNASVAMYRSALDIATKALDGIPAGLNFYRRLQWLHDEHRITPDMKDWADHVRVEGNDALHEPEDFAEGDAKPLRLFTEMFLRYIYELPGEVRAFRGETISSE